MAAPRRATGEPSDDDSAAHDSPRHAGTTADGLSARHVDPDATARHDDLPGAVARHAAVQEQTHETAAAAPASSTGTPAASSTEPSDAEQTAVRGFSPITDEPSRTKPAAARMSEDTVKGPRSAARRADVPHALGTWVGWTILGALIPGAGLLKAGRRVAGTIVLLVTTIGVVALALYLRHDLVGAAGKAIKPDSLRMISTALLVLAGLWVVLVLVSHLALRPPRPRRTHQVVAGTVAVVMCLLTTFPMLVAAKYADTTASALGSVFKKQSETKSNTRPTINAEQPVSEIWKQKPRVNIALLGGDWSDSAARRNEGIRTDTLMVASINTLTGDTTIFQIPRNTARMPFPKGSDLDKAYPNGFYNGYDANDAEFFANAIYKNVPAEHPEFFKNTDYPGADAVKLSLGTALGLTIDYFVLLNIDGLVKVIDAMGGVHLNVNEPIPIAGASDSSHPPLGWIQPGPHKLLSGWHAMWYARSRSSSSDYDRMSRQTCVIKAIIDEADPQTMLTKYESIVKATNGLILTDIPQEMLPAFVELANRVKAKNNVQRYLFVPGNNGFVPWRPDFAKMRAEVVRAIAKTEGAKPTASASPTGTTTVAPTVAPPSSAPPTTATKTTAPPSEVTETPTYTPVDAPASTVDGEKQPAQGSEQLKDACAYHPVSSASATPGR